MDTNEYTWSVVSTDELMQTMDVEYQCAQADPLYRRIPLPRGDETVESLVALHAPTSDDWSRIKRPLAVLDT